MYNYYNRKWRGRGKLKFGGFKDFKFPIFFFNDLRTIPQYLIASFLKCIAKT